MYLCNFHTSLALLRNYIDWNCHQNTMMMTTQIDPINSQKKPNKYLELLNLGIAIEKNCYLDITLAVRKIRILQKT